MDSRVCLTIITWYTSFACGRAAIQTHSCVLTTQGGLTFNLTGLVSPLAEINATTQLDSNQHPYIYSLKICQDSPHFDGCSIPPKQDTHVIQRDSTLHCHSLGAGRGTLRYADGSLSLTYSNGDTCHSNFARTTSINFQCPEELDGGERDNTSTIRFLGEEDCFYEFEWVDPLACAGKTSGVSDCQFELPQGGTYNFAPLVGEQDRNWVALSDEADITCYMVNPCGELAVTEDTHATGMEYCSERHTPSGCSGASVCRIANNGTGSRIGRFDLGQLDQISSSSNSTVTIQGGLKDSNFTATIHYLCNTGDLSSSPVYLGTTNGQNYEFQWATFAACPIGTEVGSECMVSYQGFIFNLSSIPVLQYSTGEYRYDIAMCSSLQTSKTRCNQTNTAVCQTQITGSHNHYKLGEANSTLIYQDGTLKLVYHNGQKCTHDPKPPRNTTILFICDNTVPTASISSVTEDHCEYVIEVRTKLACPPANRAIDCLFFNNGSSYDFSRLSRSLEEGNWEASGPDGSTYILNVCQPLNHVLGCGILEGACRRESHDGHMTYTDIGTASDAIFSSDIRNNEEFITLTYTHRPAVGACPQIMTNIEFQCANETLHFAVRHTREGVQSGCGHWLTRIH